MKFVSALNSQFINYLEFYRNLNNNILGLFATKRIPGPNSGWEINSIFKCDQTDGDKNTKAKRLQTSATSLFDILSLKQMFHKRYMRGGNKRVKQEVFYFDNILDQHTHTHTHRY